MADSDNISSTRRLAGELAVVFVGVLLALAADDFRQSRSERAEARESLQLLLVDLSADSSDFARTRATYERKTSEYAWLIQNWNRPSIPTDTLEIRLWTFSTRTTLQTAEAAFSGLESSNRLRLIEPDSLRQALLAYYQGRQPAIRSWDDDIRRVGERLVFDHLPRHVVHPPGAEPGTMWPVAESRLAVRTGWAEIQSDAELHNVIVQLGRIVDYYSTMLLGGEEAAVELMWMIRSEIGP